MSLAGGDWDYKTKKEKTTTWHMFIQSNMFIYVYVFVKRAEEKKNTIGSKKKKNEGKYMITKQS